MSATAIYNLPTFVVENTWPGIPLYTVTKPTGASDIADVIIDFRQSSPSSPMYSARLSVLGGEITIVSSDPSWVFTVPPQVLPLGVGVFYQSIKFIDADDKPYTFTAGIIEGELPSTR